MARKPKPPTPFEREVLDILLAELRRAMRSGAQLSIIVDPFNPIHGEGAHVFASPNCIGKTYTIEGDRPRRARRRR